MNKVLIDRLQNFTLNRKVISIDSDDRDIIKWPNSNEFEITCPQIYNHIESIKLLNIQIPNKIYNITEELQNNKLLFNDELIVLNDGYYNYENLKNTLELELQKIDPALSITYNEITNKFIFTSNTSFTFSFKNITYNCNKNSYVKVFEQNNKWGLGSIIGFKNKNSYNSVNNILEPYYSLDLENTKFIYMEIEKYNTCDELIPHLTKKYTNVNDGITNSYFAKIPIIYSEYNQSFSGHYDYSESLSYYQPPIEKISKLKFKFRYHNGILVNFNNYNISFDIEINQIRNEIKDYNVRLPFTLS